MLALADIGRSLHAYSVRTPEAYLAKQRTVIAELKRAYPYYVWRDPWECAVSLRAVVNHGRWIVYCPCGNAPVIDPEWRLACCFECGAIYRDVVVPEDWPQIETLLLRRPRMENRNWLISETVAQLAAENAAHGVA